jgi:hypothetical protein
MPVPEATKPKNHVMRTMVPIKADANSTLPDRIELVRAGSWPAESNKGMLWITPSDLLEMKANFDANIGTPGKSGQLAIDFKHEDYAEAGCWIHAMQVDGDVLYGTKLEWTTAGAAAIQGKMYKMFSPSFYPACLGEWCDPEDWSVSAKNVIVGGAFTNIPFFKGLQPVNASEKSEGGNGRIMYVSASAKGATMRTLEEVRVEASISNLDEAEKALLVDNLTKLNTEEKVKFGFETAPVNADDKNREGNDNMTDEQKEAAQIQADIRSGKKILVDADQAKALEGRVEAAEKQLAAAHESDIKAKVTAHAAAGRIKADSIDNWTKRVLDDETVLDDIAAMPVHQALVAEQGKNIDESQVTASNTFDAKIKEAMEADSNLSYGDAVKKVAASNVDLAKQHDKETTSLSNVSN